jgi:hypothetical protein
MSTSSPAAQEPAGTFPVASPAGHVPRTLNLSASLVIDLGSGLVKWARGGDPTLRQVAVTPTAVGAQLHQGRNRKDIERALLPVLQRIFHKEALAMLPLGSRPPHIALLVGDVTNPDVLKVARDFFLQSVRVEPSVLSTSAGALAAAGLTSGIVIDIGLRSTRCHAVMAGHAVPRAAAFTRRGFRTVMDALRAALLKHPVVKERHAKRIAGSAGDGVIENLLVTSSCVAPPAAGRRPFATAADDDMDAARAAALAAEVPIIIRSDVIAVAVAPAFEALFDRAEDFDEAAIPPHATTPSIATLLGTVLQALDPKTQLSECASAICIVGTCSDAPNLRRRLISESIAYVRSEAFAAESPQIVSALGPTMGSMIVADVKPYTGWGAAVIGGTLLVDVLNAGTAVK